MKKRNTAAMMITAAAVLALGGCIGERQGPLLPGGIMDDGAGAPRAQPSSSAQPAKAPIAQAGTK